MALVGHSGCGSKNNILIFYLILCILESTTLSLITRMYDPDSGQVIIIDREIIDIKL